MSDLLPFDLGEVIHTELLRDNRPQDYLMHASSHIEGSLRHAQLDVADAPKRVRPVIDQIVLMTGTLWHEWLADAMKKLGMPVMSEVNMTPWLPKGWAGTADAFIWNPELKAFVLVDFKTTKGAGLRYRKFGGASESHIAQTSAYWHAARAMGIPLAKRIAVLYLPKDDAGGKDELIEPLLVDFDPLPKKALWAEMEKRWGNVSSYVTSLGGEPGHPVSVKSLGGYITDELAPVQDRVQRVYFDKLTETYDLKLQPHPLAAYCQFPDDLCDCGSRPTNKIGMFDTDGEYLPRKGYENIEPTTFPPPTRGR